MNNNAIEIIGKYALLLSALYGLDIILNLNFVSFAFNQPSLQNLTYTKTWTYIIPYGLNLIAALYINSDIKSLNIKAKYSLLLTLIYRPIGIVLFLLYVVNNELTSQQELKNI